MIYAHTAAAVRILAAFQAPYFRGEGALLWKVRYFGGVENGI